MTFKNLKLIPSILRVLKEENYKEPTSIQAKSIPFILDGKDVLGSAQTGTGKTAAFAIPIIQHLSNHQRNLKGKQKILKHGNLNSVRNMIDIYDAMEAYWLTAKRGRIGEIYNISGKKVISVGNYLKELKKLSNVKIKSKIDKKLLRPVDVTLQIANTKKFIRDTHWSPKISFKKSMKNLLQECRKL